MSKFIIEVQANTVAHGKALSSDKYEPRGLRCDCTLSIYQEVLKNTNLLHKHDFVDSQMQTIVILKNRRTFISFSIPVCCMPYKWIISFSSAILLVVFCHSETPFPYHEILGHLLNS